MPVTNNFKVVDYIGNNVLARLVNSLTMVHTANRDWETPWNPEMGFKIGDTVRIRKPVYFTTAEGAALSLQAVDERQETLTISYQDHVDVAFTSVEYQRFLQDPETNVYEGAAQALANKVDSRIIQTGLNRISRAVGTAGSGITSFAIPNQAITMQRQYAVVNSRYMCFNPTDAGTLRNALQNSFNVPFNTEISQQAIIGNMGGHDMYEDQNMLLHTTGTFPGTPLVMGGSQTGSTINIDGFGGGTPTVFKKGDIITFDGVYAVNPVNKNQIATGSGGLMQFVVTADVVSSAGSAAVPIEPAIEIDGPYQNVTAAPADNAPVHCLGVTVNGTAVQYTTNFVYSPDCFTFACVPGPIMMGAPYSKVFTDADTGISIRLNIVYTPNTDQDILRFDVFHGNQVFGQFGTKMIG